MVGATVLRRLVRLGAVLAVLDILAVLVVAPVAGWADGVESIRTYDTRIQVLADGRITVVETIAYDFGAAQRHGIVRDIPVRYSYDDDHDRIYRVDDVRAQVDGQPAPVVDSTDGGYEHLRIGDADRTVTGLHTYTIGYTVAGVLNGFADHDELYWNAVGTEWPVPVGAATATVTAPVPALEVRCFVGPDGTSERCPTGAIDQGAGTFAAADLAIGSGLTVIVAYAPGSVGDTAPILVDLDQGRPTGFGVSVGTVTGALGLAVLGVGIVVFAAWRSGRDRRYVGLLPGLSPEPGQDAVQVRAPLTGAPPVSVEFTPPENLRPAQVGVVLDEVAMDVGVSATIVDFAVRHHLRIQEVSSDGKPDWELTRLTDGDPAFLPYERTLFDALFHERRQVRLSELAGVGAQVERQLNDTMKAAGWYDRDPIDTVGRVIDIWFVVMGIAVVIAIVLPIFTNLGLLGLGLLAGPIALIVLSGRFSSRTGRGSAILERVKGFRLYVATAEVDQIAFQERAAIFTRYLPYAMVFGLVERWTGIFAGLAEPGTAGSGPVDLSGFAGVSMASLAGSLDRFHQVASVSVSPVPIVTSSGGGAGLSGFLTGGASGGGGGGGGGGSW